MVDCRTIDVNTCRRMIDEQFLSTSTEILPQRIYDTMDADPAYKTLLACLEKEHHIKINQFLGKGSYSLVMKGLSDDKSSIAVKIIDTRIFVTEYCDGGDLLHKIKKTKRVPEPEAKALFRQLIEALIYLQKLHIVHRDLKCENVFLDHHENVKLGDFGFARYLKPHEKSSTFCGSRAYVAPEILRGIAYTGQTVDIWSAGVVLYITVTGVMPFDDRNPQKMVDRQLRHRI
ncbi:Testis-specific serine/threonine-protein kinase 3, partial [Trichostrongylus colubriformis]